VTATKPSGTPFPHVFRPITLGTMHLRNRIMLPPHGSAIGNLLGSPQDAARNIAYWRVRAADGAAWVDAVRGRVRNRIVPGFEPHGYGAETAGNYRSPLFVERVAGFVAAMHAEGALVTSQLTVIGGVPHAPGQELSSPLSNSRPHVMTRDDIGWYVTEYGYSAGQARRAGLDGIELHLNHDDLLEWFLSPHTNHRDDEYGRGSLESRARFAVDVLAGIRAETGPDMTVGVRFNLREEAPSGYTAEDGLVIAQYLESTGLVDYLHAVVGSPWGDPSYIQPQYYRPAQWAGLAGQLRRAVKLPVVYTGRVNSIEVAERVLAEGHADVVGMARAYIAEPHILAKARAGQAGQIRPCVGGNDCISRQYMEGLPFGCAVNPHASHEVDGPWGRAARPRRLLVVGGGPAGMELAVLAARAGHSVELWEAAAELGGQLRIAALAPSHDQYARYLEWQAGQLGQYGVKVDLGHEATVGEVLSAAPDVVAVATGARPHRPAIPGADGDGVLEVRDVLRGTVIAGRRVLVVAQDDHLPPLSVADHLSARGHEVTLTYSTAGPAPLLGRYIVGGILARLFRRGVTFRFLEQAVTITPSAVQVANVYSRRTEELTGFDSVVLACGGEADARLYGELAGQRSEVHLLGDAFAPRRLVAATRQAYALARILQR
jgi:2,4-dienoyl-CoA reductase-like NADH-dependent reductase (Old Yellow Enzyme family)